MKKYNIAMVTDSFYPKTGGIESHIKAISDNLTKLGHNIIIIVHKYPNYEGLINIGNLPVYYLDVPIIACDTSLPTIITTFYIFKEIYKKHNIEIVHGHQSMSTLCMEGIFHANFLGLKTVLTDHSLFEIGKFENILVNSLVRFFCKDLDAAICVSNFSKENTCLRTNFNNIQVIPNGIESSIFHLKKRSTDDFKMQQIDSYNNRKIRIVVISRLVSRKGIDLLIETLRIICVNDEYEVIIVGDGPERDKIEQFVDEKGLEKIVLLYGAVDHQNIGDILRKGDIFLNTSLTETFCIAILEALACGLLVVSTNVGGIHEISSNGRIYFCSADPLDISKEIKIAANSIINKKNTYKSQLECYKQIFKTYNWHRISCQIVEVYDSIKSKDKCVYTNILRQNFLLGRLGIYIEYLHAKFVNFIEKYLKK